MAIMVKNREDLQRLALAKGASVTFADGKKFNSSRATATMPRPVASAPAPVAAPVAEPIIEDHTNERLVEAVIDHSNQLMSEQARISIMVTQALALASQQPEPVKPREWVFEVERDSDNRIERVKARAV